MPGAGEGLGSAVESVLALRAQIQGPVILGGYSLGAEAAIAIAARYPSRFAGVLAIEGSFGDDFPDYLAAMKKAGLALGLVHGTSSWTRAEALAAEKALKQSGVPVTLRWYAGGHALKASVVKQAVEQTLEGVGFRSQRDE